MRRPTTTIFTRLLFYFLAVMLIPLLILIMAYLYYSDNNIYKIIENQSIKAVEKDTSNLYDTISRYRHKAFILAQDTEIITALENDALTPDSLKRIYSLLFSQSGGDNNEAQISIVSKSGKVQLSTHTFPECYDLRINTNEWDTSNVLARTIASESTTKKEKTIISISDHRTTEFGKYVMFSILQRVYSEDDKIIGYVIVDVFSDAITKNMNSSSIFKEEILVDNTSFIAISLLHPALYGSFSNFPELQDKDIVTVERTIPDTNFSIIATTDANPYMTNISKSMFVLVIAIAIGVVISAILSLVFSHSFAKRAKMLTDTMSEIESGRLDVRSNQHTGLVEFDKLAGDFNKMTEQLKSLMDLTREEEAKLAEAERKELEGQLNPHFLFNTLNTIKALARLHGEEEIYTISIRLGKILRSALNNHESECTLGESINLVESYMMIQKIRFKDKISYTIDAEEDLLDMSTPKLIIQPLVENAIIHGLEPKTTAGKIDIKLCSEGDMIKIVVSDDGIGFDKKPIEQMAKEGHVGLYNVYRRLQLRYGDAMHFDVDSTPGEGTTISISIKKEGDS